MSQYNKVQFRSLVGEKRYRIDLVEQNINRFIKKIEILRESNCELLEVYLDYLKWSLKILKSKYTTLVYKKEIDIVQTVLRFIVKSKLAVSKSTYLLFFNANLLNQPKFGYSSFLQAALDIYVNYIDFYQIWLTPQEALSLISTDQPSAASFSFISLITRLTLPHTNSLYLELYSTNIKKTRLALSQAYNRPSYLSIITFLFLSFLSMSHYNILLSIRYFSLAVRMAQALGYDKLNTGNLNLVGTNEKENMTKIRGIKVWKSMSMVYFFLCFSIPNLHTIRANFQPITLELPAANYSTKDGENEPNKGFNNDLAITDHISREDLSKENIIVTTFSEISYHIHNVKLKYKNAKSVELIPTSEFRLPPEKFNGVITSLMGHYIFNISDVEIQIDWTPENKIDVLNHISSQDNSNLIKSHQDLFPNLNLIFLYYPSVLVFPKAVQFSYEEALILIKASQIISNYYIKLYYYNKRFSNLRTYCSLGFVNSCMEYKDELYFTSHSPYYIQISYVIYVYLCLITEYEWFLSQGFSKDIFLYCENRIFIIIDILNEALGSNSKNERLDALSTLESISSASNNYNLPEPFLTSFKNAISLKI